MQIVVLDFGGQYTQLIARRIRELGVYSEILPCTEPVDRVLGGRLHAASCSRAARRASTRTRRRCPTSACFEAGHPVLGICYGMQAMGYLLGGHVVPAERREYGQAHLRLLSREGLLRRRASRRPTGRVTVWMSHGDTVLKPPPGFTSLGHHRQLPGRGHGRPGPAALRRPVPPRGGAHAPGQDRAQELPRRVRAPPPTGPCRRSSTRRSRASARQVGRDRGALRALGRRGLLRGRRADPQGGRRSAHVPLRGQRPPAQGRGRGASCARSGTPSR